MTPKKALPKEFVRNLKKITAKRARRVIDHILKHGHVTTEELKKEYGYNHPPRGAQDVKDLGVPIKMVRVRASDGSSAAAYSFDDPSKARFGQLRGRSALGKKLKAELIAIQGGRCAITGISFSPAELQVDHRVPYQVGGDSSSKAVAADFMLVSRSANRAKSWACEHCENFRVAKIPTVCATCYWGFPADYTHVAMQPERRLDIAWSSEDIADYVALEQRAKSRGLTVAEYSKAILKRAAEE